MQLPSNGVGELCQVKSAGRFNLIGNAHFAEGQAELFWHYSFAFYIGELAENFMYSCIIATDEALFDLLRDFRKLKLRCDFRNFVVLLRLFQCMLRWLTWICNLKYIIQLYRKNCLHFCVRRAEMKYFTQLYGKTCLDCTVRKADRSFAPNGRNLKLRSSAHVLSVL